jgi:CO/xanthine dehydrogenase FAD-binding subunit
VKPAKFEYHAPASVDEAIGLLTRYKGEARVLAGGQSLIPMMNFRVAAPAALIDLNRISTLAYIRADGNTVRIGAMTRQRVLEFSPVVREKLPLLHEAISWVGHLPTRSRGTIGGSLAHADPAAELPMALQALEGEVTARGPGGERTIKAGDLFSSSLTTTLKPDEILTEIRFPASPPGAAYAVEEFARRHGDFAITAIAALLVRDGASCKMARLATAGVGPVPVRLRAAETILEQRGLADDAIEAAAKAAADSVDPMSDHQGSAEYRRHLTQVLTRRAVHKALARAS